MEDEMAYLSYLLRLWREADNGQAVWRISLESAQTAERRYFASLDDLMIYLRLRTSGANAEKPAEQAPP